MRQAFAATDLAESGAKRAMPVASGAQRGEQRAESGARLENRQFRHPEERRRIRRQEQRRQALLQHVDVVHERASEPEPVVHDVAGVAGRHQEHRQSPGRDTEHQDAAAAAAEMGEAGFQSEPE